MSVFFYGCITMDGYLADKNHNLDWLYQTGAIEETGYESFYKSMDITIMGKRTFNEIKNIENIDSLYPTTKNYVFTHAESLSVREFIPINCDVVEYVNVHKSMLNFVKDKNKHGFFNYSNQLDKPQIGDILRVRFRGDGDNGFFKVLTAKQAEPNTPTDAIKNIEGVIKVIPPRNFGFVEDVFVDPQLIINHNLKDSESVECKALLSYNKKKKEWGWKAIEINSFINQKTTEEKWEMIKGSNFYFSDKEVSFITKAVIIQINADDGSTYKKLKVFSKLYQGGSSCFNIDKYTSKRFDHNDLINPACIISYQMKNTKTGEIIDRIRIADEPYKEIESK